MSATRFPREIRTTFTGTGLLVYLVFLKPLDHVRDATAIAKTELARRRPDLDLARFDWPDATVQRAAGIGRYSVHLKYRAEGAAHSHPPVKEAASCVR